MVFFRILTLLDPQHWSWRMNGAGNWVSHEYGFGIIDANKSVSIARDWKLSIEEDSATYLMNDPRAFAPLKHLGGSALQYQVDVKDSLTLHHVEVIVNIKHKFRGSLDIRLTSPYGTESILAEEHNDAHPNYDGWRFTTLLIWGEGSIGHWTLTIIDKSSSPDPNAVLNSWTLNLYGIKNFTAYKNIFWPVQDSSVWDLRDESVSTNITPTPNDSSYEWFQNATDSVWKIVLMATLICGIFIMVVVIVFRVRRDNSYRQGHVINKEEFISLENSDSSTSIEYL